MTKPIVTRDALKEAIRELLTEEPAMFSPLVAEVIREDAEQRRSRIRAMVMEDFKEHDAVFKALA